MLYNLTKTMLKIKESKIEQDFSRDSYLAKVVVNTDEGKKDSSIYICASYEYLLNKYKETTITERHLNDWVTTSVTDFGSDKEESVIFNTPKHFIVNAVTVEGYLNGKESLESHYR